ncbi:uncharacterized protein [Ptychodera flava]|uniref:uncharacterized protein isoform X1 n=1 Tax=Ptychodera flava TaxID=63121 RepID=UPI00396A7C78
MQYASPKFNDMPGYLNRIYRRYCDVIINPSLLLCRMAIKGSISRWYFLFYSMCGVTVLVLMALYNFSGMCYPLYTSNGKMIGYRQKADTSGDFSPLFIASKYVNIGEQHQIIGRRQSYQPKVTKKVVTALNGALHGRAPAKGGKYSHRSGGEQTLNKWSTMPIKQSNDARYLLPLFQYEDGPSGLFIHLYYAIIAAIYQNRSLVIPYLHKHLTQATGPEERTLDETFDTAKLGEIVSVSSFDEFKRDCGTHFTLKNITEGPYPQRFIDEFKLEEYNIIKGECERYIGVTMPNVNEVPPLLENVLERFKAMSQVRCLGYITPRQQKLQEEEIEEKVSKNFIRAPYIRRMANEVMGKICEGSFAVMHWRNKSAEPCRPGMETPECTEDVKEGLAYLSEEVDTIIDLVWQALQEHNMSCLYVCTAPYEQKMVDHLKKSKFVHTLEDALRISDELMTYKDDNYVLSLVEQEIAERTPLFISSIGSQWSRFVNFARNRNKKATIQLIRMPGIPSHLLSYRYLL